MDDQRAALERFAEAVTAWAGGGMGQTLVDAAANALVEGLDSPTLRVLAGAPRATAEGEATDLAPIVFEELGLVVQDRFCPAALLAGARLKARRFLSQGGDPRALAKDLWRTDVQAGYLPELNEWSGIDDWYDLLHEGIIAGSVLEIDAAVRQAAAALVAGQSNGPSGFGSAFLRRPNE